MKKIIFILFLLLIPIAYAQTFSLDVEKQAEYLAGEQSSLALKITNNGQSDIFSVSVLGYPSDWLNVESSSIGVVSGQTNSLGISVSPTRDASPGVYEYTFYVLRLSNKERVDKTILIRVSQSSIAVIKDFTLNCQNCQDEVVASGAIQNTGTTVLSGNLILNMGNDKRTIGFDLHVGEKKNFEEHFFLKSLDPGDYAINGEIVANGGTVYTDSKTFSVNLFQNIIYDKQESSNILGRFITLTAFNDGNTQANALVKDAVTPTWYAIFSGPDPTGRAGEEYQWQTQLDPGETNQIKYSILYWPVLILVALILAGGLFAYNQFFALRVEKFIPGDNIARSDRETSVSILVRNRLKKLDNVIISDIIPNHFSIVAKFETIKPVIRKTSQGTELVWRVGELGSHEERIVTYKIKPSEGRAITSLPRATLRARYRGKLLQERSNPVHVRGERREVSKLPVKITG